MLAVEIISAGAMAAYALQEKPENSQYQDSQPGAFSILTGALVRRLENSIAPQPAMSVIASHQSVNQTINGHSTTGVTANGDESQSQDQQPAEKQVTDREELSVIEQKRRYGKAERQRQLLELLRYITCEADIEIDKLADQLKVSSQTIYRDLSDLKAQHRLKIEDSAIKVIG